jgi:hypothetical protein
MVDDVLPGPILFSFFDMPMPSFSGGQFHASVVDIYTLPFLSLGFVFPSFCAGAGIPYHGGVFLLLRPIFFIFHHLSFMSPTWTFRVFPLSSLGLALLLLLWFLACAFI